MKKIFLIVIQCCVLFLPSCHAEDKLCYYSDRDNYVFATGVVNHISWNQEHNYLILGMTELSYQFDDVCFEIAGDNLTLVQDRGIFEKLETGDTVEFITAPKYFGDGYTMPIVAISVDGELLLEFESGYKNLVESLQ